MWACMSRDCWEVLSSASQYFSTRMRTRMTKNLKPFWRSVSETLCNKYFIPLMHRGEDSDQSYIEIQFQVESRSDTYIHAHITFFNQIQQPWIRVSLSWHSNSTYELWTHTPHFTSSAVSMSFFKVKTWVLTIKSKTNVFTFHPISTQPALQL